MCTCISLRARTHTCGGCAFSCAFCWFQRAQESSSRPSEIFITRCRSSAAGPPHRNEPRTEGWTLSDSSVDEGASLSCTVDRLAWPGHESTDYDSCLQGNGSDINLYVLQLPGESTSICLSVRPSFCLSPVSHLLPHRDLKAFCASLDNFLSQSSSFFKTNSF